MNERYVNRSMKLPRKRQTTSHNLTSGNGQHKISLSEETNTELGSQSWFSAGKTNLTTSI
jgi:hypothetical protein